MPGATLSFDGNSIESFVSNIHNTVGKTIPNIVDIVQHEHQQEQYGNSGVELDLNENPFVTNSCKLTTSNLKQPPKESISIVIPVHNEVPEVLIHTIKSILQNSNQELKCIVLVDVHSTKKLNSEDIMGLSTKVHVVRSDRLIGLAGARHMGAKYAMKGYSSVFSSSSVIPDDQGLVSTTI